MQAGLKHIDAALEHGELAMKAWSGGNHTHWPTSRYLPGKTGSSSAEQRLTDQIRLTDADLAAHRLNQLS